MASRLNNKQRKQILDLPRAGIPKGDIADRVGVTKGQVAARAFIVSLPAVESFD